MNLPGPKPTEDPLESEITTSVPFNVLLTEHHAMILDNRPT